MKMHIWKEKGIKTRKSTKTQRPKGREKRDKKAVRHTESNKMTKSNCLSVFILKIMV